MADLLPPPPHRSTTNIFGDPLDTKPLWFKQNSFLLPNFVPETSPLLSQTHSSSQTLSQIFVPYENLRSKLQSHLSSLKHQLIEFINRDYADFVNLNTKLVDVDATILRMRAPLTDLHDKIFQFRVSVEGSLASL